MPNAVPSRLVRMRRRWPLMMIASAIALSPLSARTAAERWQTIGDGFVQVRFTQISDDVCTWRIRNTGRKVLTRFDFSYTYFPATNPAMLLTNRDVLPFPLRPGSSVGGLALYSANTHKCPATLTVQALERDDR